jgi:hypothetical protein
MGVNLTLKKNDEHIADLGRSYHFKNDNNEFNFDYNELENFYNTLMRNMYSDIVTKIVYQPKDYSEMNTIVADAEELLCYYAEEFQTLGKKMLLSYILIDKDLSVVEE